MTEEIKRIHFFNGLFLTEEEFNLEQTYHLRFRHLHNNWFHGWGIIKGLDVVPGPSANIVTITKGAALCQVDSESDEALGKEIVLLEDTPLELPNLGQNDSVYIYIQFSEEEADIDEDKGAGEKIHWWEKPVIAYQDSNPIDDKSKVTLARVSVETVDEAGEPELKIDYTTMGSLIRTFAGFSGKRVETEKLVLKTEDGTGNMPYLTADNEDDLNHGIRIQSPNTKMAGNLNLEGGLHIGGTDDIQPGDLKVDGTTNLDQDLFVDGNTVIGNDSRAGNLNVTGNVSIARGPDDHGNDLTVSGNITAGGEGNITGDTVIGSDETGAMLTVKGKLLVEGHPAVSNAVSIQGNTRIGSENQAADLVVKGSSTIDGPGTVNGQFTVQGDGTFEGDVTVQNTLSIGSSTLNQSTSSSNLSTGGGLHIGGLSDPGDANLEVDGTSNLKGDTTIGDPDQPANLTVTGDLTVKGSTTTISTVNLEVQDNIIELNKSDATSAPANLQSGIEVFRGNNPKAKLVWVESENTWMIAKPGDSLKEIATEDQISSGVSRDIPNSKADFSPTPGQVVFFNGSNYSLALASEESKTGVFMVGETNRNIGGNDHFSLVQAGYLENLSGLKDDGGMALQAGEFYFVSTTDPGKITPNEPAGISNPIFLTESSQSGYVLPYRPSETVDDETEADIWVQDENGDISFPNGNVAIGKSHADSKLDVKGTTNIDGELHIKGFSTIAHSLHPYLRFADTSSTQTRMIIGAGTNAGYIGMYNDLPLRIANSGVDNVCLNRHGNVGIGTNYPDHDKLDVRGQCFSSGGWHTGSADYAEYFESGDSKKIPVGTAVFLDKDGKIRPVKQGETPFGIITASAALVGNSPREWPRKYLRDEFGRVITKKIKVPVMIQKKETVTKKRQKTTLKTYQEEVLQTEIILKDGKYCQVETLKTVEKEVEEPVFEEVDLYDENGETIIGSHRIPAMETHQIEIDVMDEEGFPVFIESTKTETKQLPMINPDYNEDKTYIPREERPEWNCVGLLGQLPLLKGQPAAPTWIKMRDAVDSAVEIWLVK